MSTILIKDPLVPKRHLKENEEGFKKLSYWDQMDAIVADKACPEPKSALHFVLGFVMSFLNLAIIYGLITHGQIIRGGSSVEAESDNEQPKLHELLCKTSIAWFSISSFLGLDGMYANPLIGFGCSSVLRSWQVGSVKEPLFCGRTGFWAGILPKWDVRRNLWDGPLLSSAYVLSRLWVACSPVPSEAAAWAYFVTTILLIVFNFNAYLGASGSYHGPFSAYIFLRYTNTAGSLSVLQLTLALLYIGCGLGKMGPWFVQVFIQEWTLPIWARIFDLKPLLTKDMPKDNTATLIAKIGGYGAASMEWLAGILICLPTSIIAETFLGSYALELEFEGNYHGTSCSLPVAAGIVFILSMHIYIIVHLPTAANIWILNILPAYLMYYAFYLAPTAESGFDYDGFASLPVPWQYACYAFILFLVFGQTNTDKISYTLCYRFWAGNWPHSYFFISKSGIEKMKKAMAKQWEYEEPGVVPTYESEWGKQKITYEVMGMFFNGQLNHRVLPKVIRKVIPNGKSLTQYQGEGNRIIIGCVLNDWLMGLSTNCSLRSFHALAALQEICNFDAGECILINVHSFGSHLALDVSGQSTTEWAIVDAKAGVVEKGTVSINECLSYTRPSACKEKDE